MYGDLATAAKIEESKGSTSLVGKIIDTLDYYIQRANLREQHRVILDLKKNKVCNKVITKKLTELFGLHHTENYISTIWTKKICVEIANAAKLHYDEFLARDDDNAWKRCNTCGVEKLRDNRFFVKRSKTADGLSNRCKECDRINRITNKKLKRLDNGAI